MSHPTVVTRGAGNSPAGARWRPPAHLDSVVDTPSSADGAWSSRMGVGLAEASPSPASGGVSPRASDSGGSGRHGADDERVGQGGATLVTAYSTGDDAHGNSAGDAAASSPSAKRHAVRQSAELVANAEQQLLTRYKQTWRGTFVDPRHEDLFQQRRWRGSPVPRRLAVVGLTIAVVRYAWNMLVLFAGDDSRNARQHKWDLAIVQVLIWLGVGMLLASWSPRAWMKRNWDVYAGCIFAFLLVPIVIAYPARLCTNVREAGVTPNPQCAALFDGHMPWMTAVFTLMSNVLLAGAMHASWLCGAVTVTVILCATVASHLVWLDASHTVQPSAFIGLAALVIAVTTRTHELADRHFWASLRTTARAYRMTAVAEQRGVEATTRKEAAEAQALAFQNVMRYVCHELRNPLHGIMGLLEGVRGELDDAEDWVQEDVATVWNAATSMAVILNDVLDLGQLQRGQMSLDVTSADCHTLVERCVLTLQGIATVPIVSHVASTLPKFIMVDPLRVSQIMTNAISNAAKLTKKGQVDVVLQARGDQLCFEVFDTGCGLSSDASSLFQPYQQDKHGTARTTRSRFERGTGLGLAISAQLVRLMEGEIGLENRTDGKQGARFFFHIPLVLAPAGTSAEAGSIGGASVESSSVAGSTNRLAVGPSSGAARQGAAASHTTLHSRIAESQVDVVVQPSGLAAIAGGPGPAIDPFRRLVSRTSSGAESATSGIGGVGSRVVHQEQRSSVVRQEMLTPGSQMTLLLPAEPSSHLGARGGVSVATPAARGGFEVRVLPVLADAGHVGGSMRCVHVSPQAVASADNRRGARRPNRSSSIDERVLGQRAGSGGAAAGHTFTVGPQGAVATPVAMGSPASAGVAHVVAPVNSAGGSLRRMLALTTSDAVAPATTNGHETGSRSPATHQHAISFVTSPNSRVQDLGQAPVGSEWIAASAGLQSGSVGAGGGSATYTTAAARQQVVTASSRSVRSWADVSEGADGDAFVIATSAPPQVSLPPSVGAGIGAGTHAQGNVAGAPSFRTDASSGTTARGGTMVGMVPPVDGGGTAGSLASGVTPREPGARRRKGRRKPKVPGPFAGVRVLVVDDERVNRTVLQRHCQKNGCDVRVMEDGDELLAAVARGEVETVPGGLVLLDGMAPGRPRIDAVFLDIMMQRSNGEDVCQRLRAAGILTPIVAATGNGMKEDLDRYIGAGFTRVMLKPFSSATVGGVLRALFGAPTSPQVARPPGVV